MAIPRPPDLFTGFAEVYDAHRPTPPPALIDLLTQLASIDRPNLVVDLGSGTGLSTVIWAGRAQQVVGIEPNADMRRHAQIRSAGISTVSYRDADASVTGLPHECADIVTCSQALHWLEPEPTFAEIVRVLRPGGVFAAYDYDWPPTMHWEAELAYDTLMRRGTRLERKYGVDKDVRRWSKSGHLARMRQSRRFRYVRDTLLHHVETGNSERLVGLAVGPGGVGGLLRHGLHEEEIGLDILRTEAERLLGSEPRPWYWSYRVRTGIK